MNYMNKIKFNFNVSNVYIAKDNSAPMPSNGKTANYSLPDGNYEFFFFKDGFVNKKEIVSVAGDKEIDIKLEIGTNQTKLKLPAIVTIKSEPRGAEIFLNGQKFGVTPYEDNLIAGEYNIILNIIMLSVKKINVEFINKLFKLVGDPSLLLHRFPNKILVNAGPFLILNSPDFISYKL